MKSNRKLSLKKCKHQYQCAGWIHKPGDVWEDAQFFCIFCLEIRVCNSLRRPNPLYEEPAKPKNVQDHDKKFHILRNELIGILQEAEKPRGFFKEPHAFHYMIGQIKGLINHPHFK